MVDLIHSYHQNELITLNSKDSVNSNILTRWMSTFDLTNKKVVFLLILSMASWPNITFDMCGILCGYNNIILFFNL